MLTGEICCYYRWTVKQQILRSRECWGAFVPVPLHRCTSKENNKLLLLWCGLILFEFFEAFFARINVCREDALQKCSCRRIRRFRIRIFKLVRVSATIPHRNSFSACNAVFRAWPLSSRVISLALKSQIHLLTPVLPHCLKSLTTMFFFFSSLSPTWPGSLFGMLFSEGEELLGTEGARYMKMDDLKDHDDDFLSPKKSLVYERGLGTA